MDRGAWQAMVHGVAKSWAWLKQLSTHIHMRTAMCHIHREKEKGKECEKE